MVLLTSSLQYLSLLLGAFALGADALSGVLEIDLVIPAANATYEVNTDGRFPLVWAVRNSELFKGVEVTMRYTLYNGTDSKDRLTEGTFNLATLTTSAPRFMGLVAGLRPQQSYELRWSISDYQCDDFANPKGLLYSDHTSITTRFSTKPGGQSGDILSALASNCSARDAVAFNVADVNQDTGCRSFDKDEPFPPPQPCDLQIDDVNAVAANVSKELDAQFTRACQEYAYNPFNCPPRKTSAAAGNSIGAFLLGFSALALMV